MHPIDKSRKEPTSVRLAPNREQAANIFFYMKMRDVTQLDISVMAGVSNSMVQQVIYGTKTSGRVQKAIALALGFPSWTALTSGKRGVAA